jgi:hypothetical protein
MCLHIWEDVADVTIESHPVYLKHYAAAELCFLLVFLNPDTVSIAATHGQALGGCDVSIKRQD